MCELSPPQVCTNQIHVETNRFPVFIMMSPPCTVFSDLQRLFNIKRIPVDVWKHRWRIGCTFVEHCMEAACVQIRNNHYFAFEHPGRATSWALPCVRHVQSLPGVVTITIDMCMLGLVTKVSKTRTRKRTKIMTNSPYLIRALEGCTCDRSHHLVIILAR